MGSDAAGYSNWINEEFSEIQFSDKRLKSRFFKMANQLSKKSEAPINQACEDWADTKAAYRFFNNEKVSATQIISEHYKRTEERTRNLDTVLVIQDTCYLSYTHHPKTTGLCNIRGEIKGLVMHTALAVRHDGLPVGILHQKTWSRAPNLKKSRNYRFVPIEEKEPFKWIDALRESVKLLNTVQKKSQIISVADREADVFEFMDEHKKLGSSFIIRAKSNRPINKAKKRSKTSEMLWGYMEKISPCGIIEVEVPEKKNDHKRVAKVSISFSEVNIQPPTNKTKNKDGDLYGFVVGVVFAKEINPPQDVEGLEWMLLTDLVLKNIEDAAQVINYYKMRWIIESYHKVLKSGCNIEECRLQTADRLIRYITLMSVIAWRLYYITYIARGAEQDSICTKILTVNEWKALYLKVNREKSLPNEPPTIAQAIHWIARLGGFLGRKNDGQPGITVLWRGWTRLNEITDNYLLFSESKLMGNS